ncbi:MAG: glycerophosphoryl diester phosphodiesterase [Herbinix sp.]|jgi:glycerophosphoryl diester phosphodiesterase|nr:glycerophosphoryl diester phosphodiesterase [Herbinix sp.]
MNKTLIWAHRGASGYAPENTLEAFQKAIELKADGIELDVQMTKDGQLVIIHDETVNRVSDAKGWVKDYTYEQIKLLNVNKKFPEYGKVKLPSLEEAYLLMKDTDLIINVELKNGIVFYENMEEKVLELTKKMGLQDRIIYSSFNHYSMMKLKSLDSSVKTGFLYEDGYLDMPEYAVKHKVEALHPALYNLQYPNFIKDCKDRNIKIRPWTVNKKEEMIMLCENEIDALITNYPDIGRLVVEEYAKETSSR